MNKKGYGINFFLKFTFVNSEQNKLFIENKHKKKEKKA